MNKYFKYSILIGLALFQTLNTYPQWQKLKNQPTNDQKLYRLGFAVGVNAQDLIISHTGHINADKSVWFAEIPSYSLGFTVSIIGDRYINQYFNLRVTPTLQFGEKSFVFKEQNSGEEFRSSIKTNYISLPVQLRFSAERINNFRPYVFLGGYISSEIGRPKNPTIKFKKVDYGIEFGLGSGIYFPFFKLSPEIKFSFGLRDLIDKDRSDLSDQELIKYTDALNSGKSRMITFTFNFE